MSNRIYLPSKRKQERVSCCGTVEGMIKIISKYKGRIGYIEIYLDKERCEVDSK